jgi:hypothetical protein
MKCHYAYRLLYLLIFMSTLIWTEHRIESEIILKKRWSHINLTQKNGPNPHDTKYLYLSDSAVYGFNSPSKTISGRLISVQSLSNPNNATNVNSRGCTKYVNPNLNEPFIALVSRGECSFEKKISMAADNKALGIIIHNSDQDVFTMLIKSSLGFYFLLLIMK